MTNVTDSEYKFLLRSPNQETLQLTKNPKGWETAVITRKRSDKYDGIFHEFSIDLAFYAKGGGKEFVDFEYEEFGVDAIAFINISYKCADGSFDEIFDGKFNFGKYSRVPDPVSEINTKIEIESNDFSQVVFNRGDVKVDLKSTTTLDGLAMTAKTFNDYNINLPEQPLVFSSKLKEPATIIHSTTFTSIPGTSINQLFIQDPYPLFQNALVTTIANPDVAERLQSALQGFEDTVNVAAFHSADSTLVSFPNTYTVRWRFKGTLRDKVGATKERTCNSCSLLLKYGATKAAAATLNIGNFDADGYTTSSTDFLVSTFDFNSSATISISSADDLWLFAFWEDYASTLTGAYSPTMEFDFEFAEISIEANDTFAATVGQGTAIFEAYSQICESITDQTAVAFDSNLYGRLNSAPTTYAVNGEASFLAVTNGFGIRGFEDKPINTSLNELFDATKAVYNIGLGVQKFGKQFRIIVEKLEFFYDKSEVVFKAENLRDLNMDTDLTRIYNEALFGYAEWETEETSGLDEFNSTREYELDIKNNKNKLTQICKYITAGFLIEKTRRKPLGGFASEDTEFDDFMFFLALSRSVDGGSVPDELTEVELDENVTTTVGILNPDARYNFFLSPIRNMLRWLAVLGSSMVRAPGGFVNFRAGKGNFEAQVRHKDVSSDGDFAVSGEVTLSEEASITFDSTFARQNVPLFIPEVYTYTNPVSDSEYKTIRDNPYKLHEFKDGNDRKWGWVINFAWSVQNKMGQFLVVRANIPNG